MGREIIVNGRAYSEDDLKKATLDSIIKICKELKMSFPEYGHLLYKRNILIEKIFQIADCNSEDVNNKGIVNQSIDYEEEKSLVDIDLGEDATKEKIDFSEEKSIFSLEELFKRSFREEKNNDAQDCYIEENENIVEDKETQAEIECQFEDKILQDLPKDSDSRSYNFEDLKALDYRSLADICSSLQLIKEETDDSYYGYDRSELAMMILDCQGKAYDEIEVRKYYDEYYDEFEKETLLEKVEERKSSHEKYNNSTDSLSQKIGYDGELYVSFTSTSILLKVEIRKEGKFIYYNIPNVIYVEDIYLDEVDVLFGEDLQNVLKDKLLKGTFIVNFDKWLQELGNNEENSEEISTIERQKVLKAFFNKLISKINNDLNIAISSLYILTKNNSIAKKILDECDLKCKSVGSLELDDISAIIYEMSTTDKKAGSNKYLGINLEENKCELVEYSSNMKEGEFSYILTIDKKILEQSFVLSINRLAEKIACYMKYKLANSFNDESSLFLECEKIFRKIDNNEPLEHINKELNLHFEKAQLLFPTDFNQLELDEDYYRIRNNYYILKLAALNIMNGTEGTIKLELYRRENQSLLVYEKEILIKSEEIKRIIAGEMYLGIKSILHDYNEKVILVGEESLVQAVREVVKEFIPGNMVKSSSVYDCIEAAKEYSKEVIKGTIEAVVTNHRENIKYIVSTKNFKGEEVILIDEEKNINYVMKNMMTNEVEFYLKSGCDNLEVVSNYIFRNKQYTRREETSLEKYIELFGIDNIANISKNTNKFIIKLNENKTELFVLSVQNRDDVEYIGDLEIFHISES